MPRPYSVDLRERVIADCEAGVLERSEIAKKYRISESTLYLWLQRYRAEGRLEPKPHAGGSPSRVDVELLIKLVSEKPDRTLQELAQLYGERTAQPISLGWVSALLQRRRVVRKK